MRTDTHRRLEKMKRASAILRTICTILLVLAATLMLIACVALIIGGDVTLACFEVRIPVENLTMPARLVLVGLLLATMGVVLNALLHLRALFGLYSAGRFFTRQAAANIRQFGIAVVIWAALYSVWDLVPHLFAQAHLPLLFHLRMDIAIVGAVIIVISWFMEAAAELQEESDLTI